MSVAWFDGSSGMWLRQGRWRLAHPDEKIIRARRGQRLLANGEHVAGEHSHRVVAWHDLGALLRHQRAHGLAEAGRLVLDETLEEDCWLVRLPTPSDRPVVIMRHVQVQWPCTSCEWLVQGPWGKHFWGDSELTG